MEEVPGHHATSEERGPGPLGAPYFDPEALILPGVRYSDVVNYVARMKERSGALYVSYTSEQLMRLLPADVFVQLADWCVCEIFIPSNAKFLLARFPTLPEDIAREVCLLFGVARLPFPTLAQLSRAARAEIARSLRQEGRNTMDIARQLKITQRWVNMIAPSGKPACKAGSSKRERRDGASKKAPCHG